MSLSGFTASLQSAPRLIFAAVVCAASVLPARAEEPAWQDLPWDERIGLSWYERKAEAGDV